MWWRRASDVIASEPFGIGVVVPSARAMVRPIQLHVMLDVVET